MAMPLSKTVDALEQLGEIPSARQAGLGKHFDDKVHAYWRNKTLITALEKALDADKAEIATMLATVGIKRVMVDGLRVTLVDSSRDTLHKDKLLELGVPANTIVAATTTSQFSFIRVDDTVKRDVLKKEAAAGVQPIADSSRKQKAKDKDQVKARAGRNRDRGDAA